MTYSSIATLAVIGLLSPHATHAQPHTPPFHRGVPLRDIDPDDDREDNLMSGGASGKKDKDFAVFPEIKDKEYEPGCQYGFALGGRKYCYLDMGVSLHPQDQWGWSNRLQYTYEKMPIVIGAEGCSLSGSTQVGHAIVTVTGVEYDTVNVYVSADPGWVIKEWRVFIMDEQKLPIVNHYYRATPFHPDFKVLQPYNNKFVGKRYYDYYTYVSIYVEVCKGCQDTDQTPFVKVIKNGQDWVDLPPVEGKPVQSGMPGWTIANHQTHHVSFPPAFTRPDMKVFIPEQKDTIAMDNRYSFYCPKNCDDTPCEVIIVHYHCPPCSGLTNGFLPQVLPRDGWQPGRCGPRFTSSATGDKIHDTVSYRKLIPAGAITDAPKFLRAVSNTASYVRTGAVDCTQLKENDCLTSDECRYDSVDQQCFSNWCPPPQQGPHSDQRICEPCAP